MNYFVAFELKCFSCFSAARLSQSLVLPLQIVRAALSDVDGKVKKRHQRFSQQNDIRTSESFQLYSAAIFFLFGSNVIEITLQRMNRLHSRFYYQNCLIWYHSTIPVSLFLSHSLFAISRYHVIIFFILISGDGINGKKYVHISGVYCASLRTPNYLRTSQNVSFNSLIFVYI